MFSLVNILLMLLAASGIYFLAMWVLDIVKNKDTESEDSNPIIGFFIGLITDFMDTLGIGSFAPTTLLAKVTGFIKNDRFLPGTLNVGHTIPVLIEAFLFIQAVKVEAVTLLSLIAAAVIGALVGGRIVTKLPEKKIQVVMGFALIITALLMFASKMGWLALLGANNTALKLTGIALIVGIVGNFIFGALMMAGVGLYAPCLAMVSLLGMDPKAAFPIMMGSCAALMAIGSPKFIKEGLYPRKGAIGVTIGGIIGVIVGYQFITSLSLSSLLWLIIVVVIITGLDMLRKGFKKEVA
ncbi:MULTISPECIES: TSUP family transporter [Gemella]|uniref:TSUP family transporter n=1 Tax=Gemella TaxID=1378 RepID=UPI0007681E07|nr:MULTISPECIES: TSUP family transporter [Gemella]AME10107.1 permease [Gemella sp. oral taxon 928]AXI26243.1 anion permease [Gemella sp. ND 6198]